MPPVPFSKTGGIAHGHACSEADFGRRPGAVVRKYSNAAASTKLKISMEGTTPKPCSHQTKARGQ